MNETIVAVLSEKYAIKRDKYQYILAKRHKREDGFTWDGFMYFPTLHSAVLKAAELEIDPDGTLGGYITRLENLYAEYLRRAA